MPTKHVVRIVPNKGIGATGIASIGVNVFVYQLALLDFIEVKGASDLDEESFIQFINNIVVRKFFVNLIQRIQHSEGNLSF
jgi:hypothetical protein